jgi:hypothetical protein
MPLVTYSGNLRLLLRFGGRAKRKEHSAKSRDQNSEIGFTTEAQRTQRKSLAHSAVNFCPLISDG